jgi:signal transduction histidine kinase
MGILEYKVFMRNAMEVDYLEILMKFTEGNLYWKNKDLEYLGCNERFLKIAKLKKLEDILGKKDEDLFKKNLTKEKLDKIKENDNYVLKQEKELILEETGVDETGNTAQYITKKLPLYNKLGSVIGLVGTSINITEKKELEKAKLKEKELEKKNHYTNLAACSIAHDLRTPLSSIHAAMVGIENYLPALVDGYKKAKEAGLDVKFVQNRALEGLVNLTERCNSEVDFSHHYINLILGNLSSAEINRDHFEVFSIAKIVEKAALNYPYEPHEKDLVHLKLDENFEFFGNEIYLKNIINNLIKNALFYIKEANKGEIFIEIKQSKGENNFNYLIFTDTGKGAKTEIVENMFQGFYSKRKGGTGLGLAFCKKIMLSFEGDIKAESKENKYMRFILSFPKVLSKNKPDPVKKCA